MSQDRAPFVVTNDGEVPFVAPVAGVTPTAANHLATKAYVDAGGSGGVSDHGALTGLADDDHTMYLRTDALRNLSAPLGCTAAPTIPAHLARIQDITDSQAAQDAATLLYLAATYFPLGGPATSIAMATARMLGRTAGGSGAVQELSASDVRTFLGLGALALLASVNLGTQVTGTLPIANGGTGATTAGGALAALGGVEASHENLGTDCLIDDGAFTGPMAGIKNLQELAEYLEANFTP